MLKSGRKLRLAQVRNTALNADRVGCQAAARPGDKWSGEWRRHPAGGSHQLPLPPARGGENLRKQASLARALMVFLKTNPFREGLPQYSRSVLVPLPRPTDDCRLIVQGAMAGLRALYPPGFAFQKCGVMLTDLCDRANEQLDLMSTPLSESERQRNERWMATLDKLNREHGRGTVSIGMSRKNAAWHLCSQWRTPRYTTRWDELPVVLMK